MLVVSNTSPILNLAVVGQLELIHRQFEQVQIPPAVVEELKIHEQKPGCTEIRAAIAAGWIQVQQINSPLLLGQSRTAKQ